MDKAFDKKRLRQIDDATKAMANAEYELCIYQANLKDDPTHGQIKQRCFDTIMVPYHMIKHQAHDSEENLYKQCLADKMPNITQKDYVSCTNNVYAQRVELLMSHFASSSQGILNVIH